MPSKPKSMPPETAKVDRKKSGDQALTNTSHQPASEHDVITIDIQPLMIPIAIVIAGAFISFAIFFGLRSQSALVGSANNSGGTSTTTTTTPTSTLSVEAEQVEKLITLAKSISVESGDFRSCVETLRFESEIKADMADANAIGISGTPGFVVGRRNIDNTVTGVIVAGAYPVSTFSAIIDHYLAGNTEAPTAVPELPAIKTATVSMDDDPVKGNPNADVVIVEFSDYECSYCKRHFNQTLPDVKANYIDTNKAALVFRDLPLPFHDPIATLAANAGECVQQLAGDAKYFEFHDAYFTNSKSNGAGL